MFTPSRYIRNCFLMITLATLAGCTEEGSPLGPDAPASFARGGSVRAPVVEEEFDSWDMTAWVATDHPLGRGVFESENVTHDPSSAETVLRQVPGWIDDYNEHAPHSGLGQRSPRQYRREQTPKEAQILDQ